MVERYVPRRRRDGGRWRPAHRDAADAGRRTVLALGGGAAAAVTGLAAGATPAGRRLAGWLFDGGAGAPGPTSRDTGSGGLSNRPAGQQASAARTYAEQNESYMGSTAGAGVARNTPATGRAYPTPAAAAANARVTANTPLAKLPVRHLAARATFGATPQVLADIQTMGIDAWLARQLDPASIPLTDGEKKLIELRTVRMSAADLRKNRQKLADRGIHPDEELVEATLARQIWSDRQLFEVMVDLWNDVLHVPAYFPGSPAVRAAFDRDVVRRYALDSYPDMLVAAHRHPALLLAFDQVASTKDAVNENLAREGMESFTVGVDSGCSEVDVRQAALLLTGRTVDDGRYRYRPEEHHVGPLRIMGFAHPNGAAADGERASDEYLRYLALHPSTARSVAAALATRFVSDTPPQSIVDRLAKAYLSNRGRVKPVLMTLFRSTEFWGSVGQKVRRPLEYVVATYRTLGVQSKTPPEYEGDTGGRTAFGKGLRELRLTLESLGNAPLTAPGAAGFPDVFVPWTAAGTLVGEWNEALTAVTGARTMFTHTRPEQLVARPPATAGAYLDALARRLVQQALSAGQRAAVLRITGLAEGARVDPSFNGAIAAVARAILASPLHHLR